MLGYSEDDIYKMMDSISVAYEIIDGPAEVEAGLQEAYSFFNGLLVEGRI